MNLKRWLQNQTPDASITGKLISRAAETVDPEQYLVSVTYGHSVHFGRECLPLIKGILAQFVREGGEFRNPKRFNKIVVGRTVENVVLNFEPKPADEGVSAYDLYWTRFYAALLGIDLGEPLVDLNEERPRTSATITRLVPKSNRTGRRFG